jgi:hypothetical protein
LECENSLGGENSVMGKIVWEVKIVCYVKIVSGENSLGGENSVMGKIAWEVKIVKGKIVFGM